MKKILITGMNKAQCTKDFYLNQQLKVVPSHYGLFRGLKDMGWEVIQKPVELGEDISGYDEVIIYLHNPSGFAGYVYNGLYALSQRPDAIVAFDDWQIDSIYQGVRELNENLFRKYVIDSNGGGGTEENIRKYESHYRDAIEIIMKQSNRMLISAFAGGDFSKLIDYPSDRLFSYNPNPYHLNRKPGKTGDRPAISSIFDAPALNPSNKSKEWNFASLVQGKTKKWLKDQKATWPINFYGSKKDKQERLTEGQMCEIYEKQWGCLMPGYYHAGSGWWRARPLQVADAGSILVCDDAEGILYSDAHVGVTCELVESLDFNGLIKLAKDQKDGIYTKHPLNKNAFKLELQKILDAKK
jgi:hypothetical protein